LKPPCGRRPRCRTPHTHVDDLDGLLGLVAAAEDAHERLIGVHLDCAEQHLTAYTADTGLRQDTRVG